MGTRVGDPCLFRLFAGLLDYPGPDATGTARECTSLLAVACPSAAEPLARFADSLEATPPTALEESYIRAFELNAAYCPYAGHHLFGESYKRSMFMVALKQRYRVCGLALGDELPDHLSLLLRFLAVCPDPEEGEELIREALLPALDTMLRPGPDPDPEVPPEVVAQRRKPSPYGEVLRALRLWLSGLVPEREAEQEEVGAPRRMPLPVLDAWPAQ